MNFDRKLLGVAIVLATIFGVEQLLATTPRPMVDRPGNLLVAQLNERQIAALAERVTVVVNGQNPGSGAIVGKQGDIYWVLTAKHVVATEDEYNIVTSDGVSHPLNYSTAIKLPNVDLALVQFTSSQDYPMVEIGDANQVGTGESVYIAGWPHPGSAITQRIFQLTNGSISGRSVGAAEEGYELVYTNITRSGMSGGPVFNSQGQLIGIHGRAEGEAIYNPDSGNLVAVKSGFNLGIPINTLINLSPGDRLPVNPSLPPLLWNWGTDLQAQNQFAEALPYYEKLLALDPENVPATINIGLVKHEMGQVDVAVSQWQRAIEIDPKDPEPKLALGVVLYHQGDRDRGLTLVSSALASSVILANPDKLKEYLWGDSLIDRASELLAYFKASKITELDWPTSNIRKVAVSLSADRLAYTTVYEPQIELRDLNSGQTGQILTGHSDFVNALDFSPDGKILATGSGDRTIKLWDVRSGTEIRTLTGHSESLNEVKFSPNGKILATVALFDKQIKLWDVESGSEIRNLVGHSNDIISLSFSADGQKLASRDDNGLVKLWDVNSGRELRSFNQFDVDDFSSGSFIVALSPDGQTIAANVGDSQYDRETIKLVNSDTGSELHNLAVPNLNCLSFSPDSRTIVTTTNSYVRLWEVGTGRSGHFFVNSDPACHAIAFSSNSQTLISIDDYRINTWQIP